MRRVVVTGLGMVTPLACGVEETWKRILAGESGARRIEKFEVGDLAAKIACQIPRGDGSNGSYNPDQWMEPKEQRRVDEFIVFAMCAARQAIEDSGWTPTSHEDQITTGVMIGSGIGGIEGIAETSLVLAEKGPRRVSPFFIPGRIINLASGYVSIEFGLKGPNHAVATACSTGAHAIGDSARLIALRDGDGAYRCMNAAIKRAGITPAEIDYINAHGTSTMADGIELAAVERVVGNAAGKISMSSTKSCIGHLLGAAGAVEAIFSILAIRDRVAPPTINLDDPSVETPIDLVPHTARKRDIDVALSNSFGFGGTNASLVFRRADA